MPENESVDATSADQRGPGGTVGAPAVPASPHASGHGSHAIREWSIVALLERWRAAVAGGALTGDDPEHSRLHQQVDEYWADQTAADNGDKEAYIRTCEAIGFTPTPQALAEFEQRGGLPVLESARRQALAGRFDPESKLGRRVARYWTDLAAADNGDRAAYIRASEAIGATPTEKDLADFDERGGLPLFESMRRQKSLGTFDPHGKLGQRLDQVIDDIGRAQGGDVEAARRLEIQTSLPAAAFQVGGSPHSQNPAQEALDASYRPGPAVAGYEEAEATGTSGPPSDEAGPTDPTTDSELAASNNDPSNSTDSQGAPPRISAFPTPASEGLLGILSTNAAAARVDGDDSPSAVLNDPAPDGSPDLQDLPPDGRDGLLVFGASGAGSKLPPGWSWTMPE